MKTRLILCIFLFLGACQKDYYSIVMEDGSCTQGAMTEACKDSMLRHFPIDHESFAQNPELENQVLDALHLLMTAPLSFPKDKKMLGLATIKEAEMHDFYDRFVKEDGANLNQKLLNYILHAAWKIKQGCNPSSNRSYYTQDAIHICRKRTNLMGMGTLLLHEARHSDWGQHQVYIEEAGTPWVPTGDIGMDGPYGWEVALLWGLVQGNGQGEVHLFHRNHIESGIAMMKGNFSFIVTLPQALGPVVENKDFFANYIQNYPNVEQLSYPKARPVIPFSKEPKRFSTKLEIQYYQLALIEDLDQDGNADVVLPGTKGFQIFWGNRDQTFEESPAFATNVTFSSIATIRSPDKKVLDLLLKDQYSYLYLAPINTSRTEPSLIELSIPNGLKSAIPDVVDYNQDGKDDLLYLGQNRTLEIRLGTDVKGVFTYKAVPLRGEDLSNLASFATLRDINKDGHLDLVYVARRKAENRILLGIWQPGDAFQVQPAQTPSMDFFLDGDVSLFLYPNQRRDLFLTTEFNTVPRSKEVKIEPLYLRLFSVLATGQMEEKRKASCSLTNNYASYRILLGDLDQDGQKDLFHISWDEQTYHFRLFTNVKELDCDAEGIMDIVSKENWNLSQTALGDFDGDGHPDLLMLSTDGSRTFSVFYNQGPRAASLLP